MATKNTTKPRAPKPDDATLVAAFMAGLQHPLKAEIEAVRDIIKASGSSIEERIKWAAPSYYAAGEDLLTFNPRMQDKVHLVLHHPHIESIASPLLEGKFKSRRMAYFENMAAVNKNSADLQRIVRELLRHVAENQQ